MSRKPLLALLLAAAIPAVACAQTADPTARSPQDEYQRGYAATPMPDQAAIDAQSHPAVQSLNTAADAASQRNLQHVQRNAADQAQYDADRQAYIAALVQHDAAVNRADVRYVRQQNAYADAMAVWRVQVAACKQGKRKACDMPPPNPADFY